MKRICRLLAAVLLLGTLFLSAADGPFDWSKAKEIFPGIRHAFADAKDPRILKIHVIRVDLTRKDLGFMTAKRDPDWGKPMPDYPEQVIRVRRQTSRDFLLEAQKNGIDMLVAVNATPWSPWKPPYTHKYAARMGLVISEGDKIEEANGHPVFLITRAGEFQIRKVAKDEDVSQIRLAVSGFNMILENGELVGKPGKKPKLAPRTGYGLTADKHYMLIMTVDGRMPGISEGVSTYELGQLMKQYGAWTALNMDGGGSTTLVIADGPGKVKKLNVNPFYRNVAVNLGICRIKPSKK